MIYEVGVRVQTTAWEADDTGEPLEPGTSGIITAHRGTGTALVCINHQRHAEIPEGRLRVTRVPSRGKERDAHLSLHR